MPCINANMFGIQYILSVTAYTNSMGAKVMQGGLRILSLFC